MRREDHGFFYRYRIPFKVFGVVCLAAVLLTGSFYLSKLGPKKVDPTQINYEFDEATANDVLAQSEKDEETFRTRAEQRPPTADDFALLKAAIDGQRKYLEMRGGFHEPSRVRLEELLEVLDEYKAREIYEESLQLENESRRLVEEGKAEEGLKTLERALFLQRRINENFSLSSLSDPRRYTRLSREVQFLTAKPLYEESVKLEGEADAAVDEEKFGRAKLLLRESISLQKELNMEFRSLQFADIRRLSGLQEKLASLESSDIYEQIVNLRKTASDAEKTGDFDIAAEAYQNAYRLQRKLNDEFPDSRFAGARLVEELQNLRENALSRELGEEIITDMARLDEALEGRTIWQAVEILRTLYPKVQQFTEQFPRSTILGENALLKLQYLSAIEDDLSFLQDRIYGQLLYIDGVEDWRMLRTEVSQALYMSVMLNANPSRRKGELLPVESGTWDDATAFAERISWILGRPCRLPTQDEYYAALGSLRYVDLRKASWNLENSDGVTHDVATKEPNNQGYHDLLGNVAEWLFSQSLGEGEGYLAGGSIETSIDEMANVPMQIINRRTRNRSAGFRIVVQITNEN
ncbi:MAG: SUMF1/EgtB/PvdO family nonheme iron enzyme [Verrucomicrobiota bacterium]